jgi:hypothetical protein
VGLSQARREKAEVIVEGVGVGPRANRRSLITPPLEPRPIAFRRRDSPLLRECLRLTRVEGRVDVDEVHTLRWQRRQHREALTEEDPVLHRASALC